MDSENLNDKIHRLWYSTMNMQIRQFHNRIQFVVDNLTTEELEGVIADEGYITELRDACKKELTDRCMDELLEGEDDV